MGTSLQRRDRPRCWRGIGDVLACARWRALDHRGPRAGVRLVAMKPRMRSSVSVVMRPPLRSRLASLPSLTARRPKVDFRQPGLPAIVGDFLEQLLRVHGARPRCFLAVPRKRLFARLLRAGPERMRPNLRGRVNHKIAHYLSGTCIWAISQLTIKRWKHIEYWLSALTGGPLPTMEKTSVVGSMPTIGRPRCSAKINGDSALCLSASCTRTLRSARSKAGVTCTMDGKDTCRASPPTSLICSPSGR